MAAQLLIWLDRPPGRARVVTLISSAPRWLFSRLAVVVTLVLWLPDLYLLDLGQPGRAVAVLTAMPVAIALVACSSLVHIAEASGSGRGW